MNIDTKRLTLRHWEEDDAPALFKYASDERVGPIAAGHRIKVWRIALKSFVLCLPMTQPLPLS